MGFGVWGLGFGVWGLEIRVFEVDRRQPVVFPEGESD